jgi:hypothetical protein
VREVLQPPGAGPRLWAGAVRDPDVAFLPFPGVSLVSVGPRRPQHVAVRCSLIRNPLLGRRRWATCDAKSKELTAFRLTSNAVPSSRMAGCSTSRGIGATS